MIELLVGIFFGLVMGFQAYWSERNKCKELNRQLDYWHKNSTNILKALHKEQNHNRDLEQQIVKLTEGPQDKQ